MVDARAERAARAGRRAHERRGACGYAPRAGSQRRSPRAHHGAGASASPLRRRMIYLKLRQAGDGANHKRVRSAVCRGARCRSGADDARRCRSAIASRLLKPTAPQRGVVGGLRVRSHGRGPSVEVPGDRG